MIFFLTFEDSFATSEPILITISPSMEKIVFDGKWTNYSEWKQSSHNVLSFDDGNTIIHLRTAHFGDYIYVFVDPISDFTLDEKNDKATICIDGKNNKNIFYDSNDFCFFILLNAKEGNVSQGTTIDNQSIMKLITDDDFVGISSISDQNDRYSIIPHPSYEFKIPIKLFERSDNYGFFVSVYDATSNKYFSWPENSTLESNPSVSFPSQWGDIISPDKSLPEFNLPILVMIIMITLVIFLQSKTKSTLFRFPM